MKTCQFRKITALLSAIVLTFTGVSYNISVFAADNENTKINTEYEHYEIQWITDAGEELKAACEKNENETEVLSCYQKVFDLYQKYGTDYIISLIQNEVSDAYDEYQYESSIGNEVLKAFEDAAYSPVFESQYSSFLKQNISEAAVKAILKLHDHPELFEISIDIPPEINQKNEENLQNYFNRITTIDEFELETAKIYLDAMKYMNQYKNIMDPEANLSDFYYRDAGRDYSFDDLEEYKNDIVNTLNYISGYAQTAFSKASNALDEDEIVRYMEKMSELAEITDHCDIENTIFRNIILNYSSEISDELSDSARFLLDNDLLFTGNSFRVGSGFTTTLASEKAPVTYIYRNSFLDTFQTSVHEFGHFAGFRNTDNNTIPYGCDTLNIDFAEIQSQALEILFYNFYDELFGEFSENIQLKALSSNLETLSLMFIISDFENEVSKSIDTITPEEMVKLFHNIQSEYGYPANAQTPLLYMSTPFYVISYIMSMLPSLDMLASNEEDFIKASELYMKVSKTDIYDDSTGFLKKTEKAGFGNILSKDYLSSIRFKVGDFCDQAEGTLLGDINEDKAINAEDLMLLKRIMVGDIEPGEFDQRHADITRDGKLTALDLAKLVYKILQ